MTSKEYEIAKLETTTQETSKHHLHDEEEEYLSTLDLIHTHGFIKITSIIWSPCIVFTLVIILIKILIKRR